MLEVIKYMGKKLFARAHAIRLGMSFIINSAAVFVSSSIPFLFGIIIKNGGEYLGLEISLSNAIKFYAASLGLSKIFPTIRKLLRNVHEITWTF